MYKYIGGRRGEPEAILYERHQKRDSMLQRHESNTATNCCHIREEENDEQAFLKKKKDLLHSKSVRYTGLQNYEIIPPLAPELFFF